MRIWVAMVAVLMGVGMSEAQGATGKAVTLAGLRDHARVLLVFGATAGAGGDAREDHARVNDEQTVAQLGIMQAHAAEARERDLVTIAIPAAGVVSAVGDTGTRLAPENEAAARRRFHVNDDEFAVVLVGKDGGEKLRSKKPVSFDRLQQTIDAMPMRKQEMKARGPQ